MSQPARRPRRRDSQGTRDAILRVVDETKPRSGRARSEQVSQGPKVASRADVKHVAAELSEAFLHCRDYGHQWRMANARREGRLRLRTMYCPSCKYNKYQTLDSNGIVIEEKKDYPEGYLIKGMGHIRSDTKGLIRLESIDRLIEKTEGKSKK